MNRTEFEYLRDLPDKTIDGDITFSTGPQTSPLQKAEGLQITNRGNVSLMMTITHNPEVGSTSINVHVPGLGAICRLDVDGAPHRPYGRCHKHALQSEHCPRRNLPDGVIDVSRLSGLTVEEVFTEFCQMANITHNGAFRAP